MNLRPAWQPGVSPNPGGRPKGTPQISVCYARLLALSAEDLDAFVPSNVAESIALARVRDAQQRDGNATIGLKNAAEITDRTEGKAPQRIEHSSNLESERMIIRLQERFLARTGIELTRADAIARLIELEPALAGQLAAAPED